MPTPGLEPLIRAIHAQPTRLVLAITGGGSEAIGELLGVPGGSRTVIEAVVPYAAGALDAFLGRAPQGYCTASTSRAMAMAAFRRAQRLAGSPESDPVGPLCGVACTASLVSDAPKRGEHRVFVAWQTASATKQYELTLEKGLRTRAAEEELASYLILHAIVEAVEVAGPRDFASLLGPGDRFVCQRIDAQPGLQSLFAGEIPALPLGRAKTASAKTPRLLLPGAFNPIHAGHRRMAAVAQQIVGVPCDFEISLENVDKPPLDFIEIDRRCAQFQAGDGLWLTRAATFVEKARLFPGATFAVGLDTLLRIGEQRYYSSPAERAAALAELAAQGCRFLVFGRRIGEAFQTLADVAPPPALARLCQEVTAQQFRADISSTKLREEAAE